MKGVLCSNPRKCYFHIFYIAAKGKMIFPLRLLQMKYAEGIEVSLKEVSMGIETTVS